MATFLYKIVTEVYKDLVKHKITTHIDTIVSSKNKLATKIFGRIIERFESALQEIEKGDKVIITEISRLARSVIDLWEIANEINKVGANLISLKENIDLETAAGRLMFTMLSGMAQFERDVISERTVDALLAKKKNGVVLGRPRTIKPKVIEEAIQDYVNGGGTFKQVASRYNISDATLCNSVKKWRSQNA
jgi:DNA invertase Pin-like site-specific DNA recombinase